MRYTVAYELITAYKNTSAVLIALPPGLRAAGPVPRSPDARALQGSSLGSEYSHDNNSALNIFTVMGGGRGFPRTGKQPRHVQRTAARGALLLPRDGGFFPPRYL